MGVGLPQEGEKLSVATINEFFMQIKNELYKINQNIK